MQRDFLPLYSGAKNIPFSYAKLFPNRLDGIAVNPFKVSGLRNGGWGGIRTLGTCEGTHAFQACPLNRSGTHPWNFRAWRGRTVWCSYRGGDATLFFGVVSAKIG